MVAKKDKSKPKPSIALTDDGVRMIAELVELTGCSKSRVLHDALAAKWRNEISIRHAQRAADLRKWLEGPDIVMSTDAMDAAWGLVEAFEKGLD